MQQRIRTRRALAPRAEVVAVLVVDRVDLGKVDEIGDVDRPRPARLDGLQFLVAEQDIVPALSSWPRTM
jgi:hypothetical protein